MRTKLLALVAVLTTVSLGLAEEGMTKGTPELKSASALAFGPKGVLFVGDSKGGTIYAIDTGDRASAPRPVSQKPVNVERIDAKVGAALGVSEKDVSIKDLKVNPDSGNVYLAVARAGQAAIVKVTREGAIEPMNMKDVMFSKIRLPNIGSDTQRYTAITSMAFLDGRLFVAGMSNEEFASTLWALPYPFGEAAKGSGIQIYHGAHGRLETSAPIRTFTPFKIGKEESIVATYQCTPLVTIPVSELKAGAKVKGTTIAELGNHNTPLSMIAYSKDGKDYLLSANDSHGLIKIPTADFESAKPISTRISDTAGIKYEKLPEFKTYVTKLDKLDDSQAILLMNMKTNGGGFDLKTIPLP